ncbi:MAG TPA: hypothetical protein GXX75_02360 [Clostridiales bacterium]|nr:hypothetical protein [Clostridiales bacterium]
MKRYIALFILLVSVLVFTGRDTAVPNPDSDTDKENDITGPCGIMDGEITPKGNISVESPSVKLDLVSAEYRAMWKERYNYDTPMLIDNLADLTDFLKNHPVQLSSVDALQQNYNDEFFTHSVVYAYVESEGSGSIKLMAKSAELNRDKLKLYMERIVPQAGTADMAALVCLFGISRDDNKSAKSVEGIVECITLEESH